MEKNKSSRFTNLVFMAACVVVGPGTMASAAVLYSIDRQGHQLVKLDTVAQTITPIGPLGQTVRSTDLAIANGTLYAVDTSTSPPGPVNLLTINTQTGAVASSVLVTCTWCAQPVTHAEGLAQAGGKLYVAFRYNPALNQAASHAVGELDTGTGDITNVIDYELFLAGADFDGLTEFPCGLTPFPASGLFAVDVDPGALTHTYFALSGTIAVNGVFPHVLPAGVNDLVFCGGELYGIDDGVGRLRLHDPTSGAILSTVIVYSTIDYSLTGLAGRECCVQAPNDMVAWWPLDEDPGPTAHDIVGGNHGTHFNVPAPLVGELVENSLCFDGVSQYVNVPTAAALNLGPTRDTDFTIDAWVRADNLTGVFPIVDKRSAGPEGYQLFVFNGRLGFQMADTDGSNCNCGAPNSKCTNYIAPTADITVGVWHHVAVTVHRSGMSPIGDLYVDGNPVLNFNARNGLLANGADLWMGRAHTNACGGTAYWDGCIDEVEFFDVALSIDEIRSIHDACRGGKCKWCPAIDEFCADLQDDCMGSGLPDSTCLPTSVIIQTGLPPVVEECDCCELDCCRGIQITEIPPGEYELSCNPVDCPPPQVGICQIFVDGVPQDVSNILASTLADGSRVRCDCLQVCPLPVPEPDPSCAALQETDCPTDDPNEICWPMAIQLVDDGASGFVPVAVECDCKDCHAVYTGGMVPPVDCVGTCPPGQICTLIASDTSVPPDGVDDYFECHCFVDCCLPDGTCITTTAGDCQFQSGTEVPDCLGDSNFNGVDDACDVDCCFVPPGTCVTVADLLCEPAGGFIVPICLGDNNFNGMDDACEEHCPLPDPEPTPSCAERHARDCISDDPGLTCLPTVIQLVDDGAGGWTPDAVTCDCAECYAVYNPAMVPPVECVGTCPAGQPCTLIAVDTDVDGVDDRFKCKCFVDCCLPDGTCITTTADDCLDWNGTEVPDCLGDEACCLPDGTCVIIDRACCEDVLGGQALGTGSVCLGDLDLDGVDDACDCAANDTVTYILRSGNPAITVWGGAGGVPLSGSAFVLADFDHACNSPQANVVNPHPNWLPGSGGVLQADPPADWIAANPNNAPHSGLYCYEFDVCCPDIVMSEITFSFAVDDRLGDLTGGPNIEGVYINTIAQAGFNGGGFATETTIIGGPIPLVTGANTLHVYARDTQFSVSGLIFSAGINVQCASEACCFTDGTCLDLDPCCCTEQGGVPQGTGSVCLGDGNFNGIDDACEEHCPLPEPEPTPSCAQRYATDCISDDPGLTCLPTIIQLVDDGAGGLIPVAVECDCAECYAVYNPAMVPPVECVGTCPADETCTLVATDTSVPPDGVDDWFECKCFVDCCLPDGTCITTTADDCLARNGTEVPECLGDSNLDGIDDACECGVVDDGAAEPTCAGVCPGPLPPVTECVPRCVNHNPQTGQTTVKECDCLDIDECRVEIGTGGLPPDCNISTCDPFTLCVKSEVVLGDGTIDICCDCTPAPPIVDKNRYVSFRPAGLGAVAYKLDMVSSLFHPAATVSGWLGAPDANGIASLVPGPVTRSWTEAVVNVTGCEIAPVAEFELKASTDGGGSFLPPIALRTTPQPGGGKWWGDTVGSFDGSEWTPPQGVTNIDDAVAAIKTWQGADGAPEVPRTDVEPQEPNRVVNFNDVLFVIFAFQGDPYPFGCPDDPCQENLVDPCP